MKVNPEYVKKALENEDYKSDVETCIRNKVCPTCGNALINKEGYPNDLICNIVTCAFTAIKP